MPKHKKFASEIKVGDVIPPLGEVVAVYTWTEEESFGTSKKVLFILKDGVAYRSSTVHSHATFYIKE